MRLLNSCCIYISLKNACIALGAIMPALIVFYLSFFYTNPDILPYLEEKPTINIIKYFSAVDCILWVIISLVLLVGTLKENQKSVLCWVIGCPLIVAFSLVVATYIMARDFIEKNYLRGSLILVAMILATGEFTYLWLVVFSFFQKLRNGETVA